MIEVGTKVVILPREGDPKDYYGSYTTEMTQHVGTFAKVITRDPITDLPPRKMDDGYKYYLEGISGYMWSAGALLPITNFMNWKTIEEGSWVVFDDEKFGIIKVSKQGNYYLSSESNISALLKERTGLYINNVMERYLHFSSSILVAPTPKDLERLFNNINKLANNETELQGTEAHIRGAENIVGNRICSKITKAAISSQPLGYTVCIR